MDEIKSLDLRELAERIYNLDEKAYTITGSALGRVYNGDKEHAIAYIIDLLEAQKGADILRDELALIGNMGKTIAEKHNRTDILDEYNAITKQTKWQADHYTRVDILDQSRAALNTIALKDRFSEEDKRIICIARTYGSGGHEIGFALANEKNMSYYDKKIFMEILKRMSAGNKSIWEHADYYEKAVRGNPVYAGMPFENDNLPPVKQMREDFSKFHGLPRRDALYFTQSKMILDLAKTENFVMLGRYADVVLTNEHIPHISIFITAPLENRIERLKSLYPERSEKQIRKMLIQSDKTHLREYRYFTGRMWGRAENYDLTINSASYGISGSVAMLLEMLEGKVDYK
ncbi:MAG: cytidylate kinase-like family protein [Clostridiales bacterium]|nr:cytidylate kinase-like family protein [Clostridiales bacterium]